MVYFYKCEDKAYEKELNIWATFYMEFNDDNMMHCDCALHNSFVSGNLKETVESVREANFKWLQEIKRRGHKVKKSSKLCQKQKNIAMKWS